MSMPSNEARAHAAALAASGLNPSSSSSSSSSPSAAPVSVSRPPHSSLQPLLGLFAHEQIGGQLLSFLDGSSTLRLLHVHPLFAKYITSLDLSGNLAYRIDDALVAQHILPKFANIKKLNLTGSKITARALEHIAQQYSHSLEEINLEGCGAQLRDQAIFNMAVKLTQSPQFSSLVLNGLYHLSNSCLKKLAELLPQLRRLEVNGIPGVNDDLLQALAAPFHRSHSLPSSLISASSSLKTFGDYVLRPLSHVSVNSCSNVTDAGIAALSNGLRNTLTSLSATYCAKLTDKSLHRLASDSGSSITHLNLYGCASLGEGPDAWLVLRQFTSLRVLDLSMSKRIDDQMIMRWVLPENGSTSLPAQQLQSLNLYDCSNVSLQGIYCLLYHCPSLTYLGAFGVSTHPSFLHSINVETITSMLRSVPRFNVKPKAGQTLPVCHIAFQSSPTFSDFDRFHIMKDFPLVQL